MILKYIHKLCRYHNIPFFSLAPTLEHRADFSVSLSFTDRKTPWRGDQLFTRPLPKHRTTQKQKSTHTHIKHPCLVWDSNL
jgi:hypothetical protein